MPPARKTAKRVAVTALVLLILLLLLALAAPKILNLEPTRQAIAALVQETLGGDLTYQEIDISFFPSPTATVRGGKLGVGNRFQAQWKELKVRPDLLSLLSAAPRIAELDLTGPQIRYRLRPTAQEPEKPSAMPATVELPPLPMADHDLQLKITNGTFHLEAAGEDTIRCRNINGRLDLTHDQLAIKLSGTADAWQELDLTAQFEPSSWRGSARIEVQQLHLEKLASMLAPGFSTHLGESVLDGSIQLTGKGKKDWSGKINGTIPVLTLLDTKGPMVIRGGHFAASVQVTNGDINAELDKLVLTEPSATFSGRFSVSQAAPHFQMVLTATDANLDSARPIALRLFSRQRVARKIFDVLRGGEVATVTFESHGNNRHEIGNHHHFRITGHVNNGDIHVPTVDLDLVKVAGDFVVQDGILQGTDLVGRMGRSNAKEGRLTLDLTDGKGPFALDLLFDADLQGLPPLLSRLVKKPSFVREMGLIEQIDGRAQGRLIIGDRRNNVRVQVYATEIHANSSYRRIPYPVRIEGGGFQYRDNQVTLDHLRGILGTTAFQDLSVNLDWTGPPRLTVNAPDTKVNLPEIFSWLVSYPLIRKKISSLHGFRGSAQLTGVEMNGPILHPDQWQFKVAGEMRQFSMDASFLPSTLATPEGTFSATPEALTFQANKARLLDTSGSVSGTITDYLKGVDGIKLRVRGKLQPKTYRWCAKLFQIPDYLTLRAPFYLSKSLLTWDRAGKVSITASVAFPDGPDVGIVLTNSRHTLRLERLVVNDTYSRAEFVLKLRKSVLNVQFKGQINGKTLDRIFAENDFLTGSINGKMTMTIPFKRWTGFTAQGVLIGTGVNKAWSLAWQRRWPFTLDTISLQAEQNLIKISSATLNWDGAPLQVSGQVRFLKQKCAYDLNVDASKLTWEQLLELAQPDIPQKGRKAARKANSPAAPEQPSVKGTIRLRADRFHYGTFVWEPFRADLTILDKSIDFRIVNARNCGIDTPGTGSFAPGRFSIGINAKARHQPINSTLTCFWNKQGIMDGAFDFDARFTSSGKPEHFWKSLGGNLKFTAQNGRIYRFTILSKVFALLNLTEIFRGKTPDLVKEGFAYNTMALSGPIEQGTLHMDGYLDGASMRIAWKGECNLKNQTVDMTVLVAPLKTVDSIIKHIPLANKLFKGSIVSIPVKVTGPLDNPEVVPLPATAVGKGILGFIERTLKLPLIIIQPLLSPDQ